MSERVLRATLPRRGLATWASHRRARPRTSTFSCSWSIHSRGPAMSPRTRSSPVWPGPLPRQLDDGQTAAAPGRRHRARTARAPSRRVRPRRGALRRLRPKRGLRSSRRSGRARCRPHQEAQVLAIDDGRDRCPHLYTRNAEIAAVGRSVLASGWRHDKDSIRYGSGGRRTPVATVLRRRQSPFRTAPVGPISTRTCSGHWSIGPSRFRPPPPTSAAAPPSDRPCRRPTGRYWRSAVGSGCPTLGTVEDCGSNRVELPSRDRMASEAPTDVELEPGRELPVPHCGTDSIAAVKSQIELKVARLAAGSPRPERDVAVNSANRRVAFIGAGQMGLPMVASPRGRKLGRHRLRPTGRSACPM